MGTDICGFVEVETWPPEPQWCTVLDIGWLFYREYDLFATLFGVRGNETYRPLFPRRGIPPGVESEPRCAQLDPICDKPTWVTYGELARIDLSEPLHIIHAEEFKIEEERWVRGRGEISWDNPRLPPRPQILAGQDEVKIDNKVYKVTFRRQTTRGEILAYPAWQAVLSVMKVLADEKGADGKDRVRLVVWFSE